MPKSQTAIRRSSGFGHTAFCRRERGVRKPNPSSRRSSNYTCCQSSASASSGNVEKFEIDVLVKKLAESWSGSLVQKVRIYTKAAMEEAIDQGLLDRNPARKIVRPTTRATCRRFLSLEEITKLLDAMEGRDRLVARICIVLGLRPGEVFATKWDDFDPEAGRLRIDESAVDCEIKDTKTPGSRAWVWLPKSMTEELKNWRATSSSTLIFPSRSTRPISTRNFLRRHIWPAAVRAGIMQKKTEGLAEGQAVGRPGDLGQLPRLPQDVRHVVPEGRDHQGYPGAAAAYDANNHVGRVRPGTAGERADGGRGPRPEALRVRASTAG